MTNHETNEGGQHELALLLRAEECARILRVSKNHVYNLVKQGAIPHQRYGKLIRIPRWALMQHLSASQAVAIAGDQSVHVMKQEDLGD